ncbi:MAG: HAD-IA family hydrolase [Acidimicrobiales bacterium]
MLSRCRRRTTSQRIVVWLLAGLALLASGCRTDVLIGIDVEEDGSGLVTATVILDRETAAAVLDLPSADGLALEDLFQAGWEIDPPQPDDNGAVRVSASKAFGTPQQFSEVMAELAGEQGVVGPFTLSREKAFATVDYRVDGSLAPVNFEGFSDDQLSALLGRSVSDIASRYGATPGDVFVSLTVRMPGTVDGDVSGGSIDPDGADTGRIFATRLDAASPTPVTVASSTREVAALVWRGVAIVAAVLAVLVAFGHLLRVLRPERRGKSKKPAAPKPKEPKPVINATEVAEPESADDDLPAVVALDGMGVLYRQGDDINQLLVPFVRQRGSEVSHDKIVARARAMSLGRITAAEFWAGVGLDGDPNELDDDYLNLFQLSPGVVRFLRYLRENGVQVACVTNDSTNWATKLRAKHSLEGLIDPWIVSGAIGVRKPDQPIYEVLRRLTRAAPSTILVVDDELDNLDAARRLGFRTAWFAPEANNEDARQHAILRSFQVDTAPVE